MSSCSHSRERLMVEVWQCEICGRVEQRRVREGVGPPPARLVQQGYLTADIVIESLGLDGADAEYIRGIEVCEHPAVKVVERRCKASGKSHMECEVCGRKWSTAGKA